MMVHIVLNHIKEKVQAMNEINTYKLYGNTIKIIGFDVEFYPHQTQCLVLVNCINNNYNKKDLNIGLLNMLKTLNTTFKLAIDFFIVPIFSTNFSEIQLSFMEELKNHNNKYLIIMKHDNKIVWNIFDIIPQKYVIGSEENVLIIPV